MRHRYTLLILLLALGCKREERDFHVERPLSEPSTGIPQGELQPGQKTIKPTSGVIHAGYEETAYAVSEGQRLYRWYNCNGCHANGGGGIGPALMDDVWFYGYEPRAIYATIVEGRPNGMPSFRGRIPEFQVWQIVAYVRSIAGLVRRDAVSARQERMKYGPNPILMEPSNPRLLKQDTIIIP
jgi:cytochrome c oxidase cbb3-type subunit III